MTFISVYLATMQLENVCSFHLLVQNDKLDSCFSTLRQKHILIRALALVSLPGRPVSSQIVLLKLHFSKPEANWRIAITVFLPQSQAAQRVVYIRALITYLCSVFVRLS